MAPTEARTLEPGDRIRLRPQPTWATNPPSRTTFTVAKMGFRAGSSGVAHHLGGGGSVRAVAVDRAQGASPLLPRHHRPIACMKAQDRRGSCGDEARQTGNV